MYFGSYYFGFHRLGEGDISPREKQFIKNSLQPEQVVLSWDELKKDGAGLVPVIVQDAADGTVLMMAYMNQEAYETTLRDKRMTYWSRSRSELWIKGMTSGHFQYVKELRIDCDNDTILALVEQVGAACHTGNRSCFYRNLVSGTDNRNI